MPRQVDAEERRRRIAEAVFRLIGSRGLEAVSLRDVAAEAGVSMGQVQHWFSTKQDMLLFALAAMRERVLTRLARDVAALPDPSPRERIMAAARVMLPLDEPGREEARVNVAFVAASVARPPFVELLREGYERLLAASRVQLADARRQGLLRPGVDVDDEAAAVFFLVQGLIGPVLVGACTPDGALALVGQRLDQVFRA